MGPWHDDHQAEFEDLYSNTTNWSTSTATTNHHQRVCFFFFTFFLALLTIFTLDYLYRYDEHPPPHRDEPGSTQTPQPNRSSLTTTTARTTPGLETLKSRALSVEFLSQDSGTCIYTMPRICEGHSFCLYPCSHLL